MTTKNYLLEKDNKLYFNGVYMEIYIPNYLFDNGLTYLEGDVVSTLGLFNFRVFGKEDDDRSKLKLETFKFPTRMQIKPTAIVKEEFELIPGTGIDKYNILKLYQNDLVMVSMMVVQSIDNVNDFIALYTGGKLPNTIPYKDVTQLLMKCTEINGINLNVPATTLSAMTSEIYRYKSDMSTPFRKIIGKDNAKATELDYIAANPRTICAYNSSFSALSFEDIDAMIINSVNKKRYNKKENYTPIEKIIQV